MNEVTRGGWAEGHLTKNMKVRESESYTCIFAANKVVMINKSQEKGFAVSYGHTNQRGGGGVYSGRVS